MTYQAYVEFHNRLFTELSKEKMDVLELPGLLWVDRENQQFIRILEDEGHDMIPIRFPAVSIEYGEITWAGDRGEFIITFRVAYEAYADSYQNGLVLIADHDDDHSTEHTTLQDNCIGSVNQVESLKDLRFVEQVHLALQGFQPTCMGPLQRVASRFSNQYGNIIVHELDYSVKIEAETKKGLSVDLVEICAVPAFPTPPAYVPATLYKKGQKVTFNAVIYICIQTMTEATVITDLEFWRPINSTELYTVV